MLTMWMGIYFDAEKYSKYGKFVNIENIDRLESEDDGLGKRIKRFCIMEDLERRRWRYYMGIRMGKGKASLAY